MAAAVSGVCSRNEAVLAIIVVPQYRNAGTAEPLRMTHACAIAIVYAVADGVTQHGSDHTTDHPVLRAGDLATDHRPGHAADHRADFISVVLGRTAIGVTILAVMPFKFDVAACDIKRAIQALEFTRIDESVGTEVTFHGTDFMLLVQQPAEFEAGQIALAHAGMDAFHLPILTGVDMLREKLALLVGMNGMSRAVTVVIPASLRAACRETNGAECQQGDECLVQFAFHDVAPLQFRDVAVDSIRQRTTAL